MRKLICEKCETRLPYEANFCFHCGHPLRKEPTEEEKLRSIREAHRMARMGEAIMKAQMMAEMEGQVPVPPMSAQMPGPSYGQMPGGMPVQRNSQPQNLEKKTGQASPDPNADLRMQRQFEQMMRMQASFRDI